MQSLVEHNRFEIKHETEDQGQSIPKSTGTLSVLKCIFGLNLEILTSTVADLSCGQTHKLKKGYILSFPFLSFDLEVHGQSPHKTTGILTEVFYISGPNVVILA